MCNALVAAMTIKCMCKGVSRIVKGRGPLGGPKKCVAAVDAYKDAQESLFIVRPHLMVIDQIILRPFCEHTTLPH